MNKVAFISLITISGLCLMPFQGYAAAAGGNSAGTSQVIVFSDVHFNPFYDTTLFPALVAADASEWEGIFASSSISEPSIWGEDSNYPLFALALTSIRARSTSSSVAIFPGDILVHQFDTRFYALYGSEDEAAMKSFLYKTVTFFAGEVRAYLGDIPVMFELGNNDAYEGDFKIEPDSRFLSDTAEPFYTSFLNGAADHDAFLNTYKAGGYYSASPLGTNLVVIALNSIFFSPDAATNTSAAATTELSWFESTLSSAASSGRKVWLLTHIPPGANIHANKDRIDSRGHLDDAKMMWEPDFQTRFLNILAAYSNAVTMMFTGHTHMDEYRLPVCALEVTPAISPIDGNNPAFKVFTYYTNSFEIADYSSINYDLAAMPGSFQQYYTFSSTYKTDGPLATMLECVFPTLRSNAIRRAAYKGHYYSGHDSACPINDTNWPVYWCGIGKIQKQDYLDCVNGYTPALARLFWQWPYGQILNSLMNTNGSFNSITCTYSCATDWQICAGGDIDRDGVTDLIMQAPEGQIICAFMNAEGTARSVNVASADSMLWQIRAAGDINLDGIADLIAQAPEGQVICVFMNAEGTARSVSVASADSALWQIRAAGDINLDGVADLIAQAPGGQVICVFMNADGTIGSLTITNPNSTFVRICAAGDIDGDGIADLIGQLPTGEAAVWLMNTNGAARAMLMMCQYQNEWRIRTSGY